MLSRLNPFSPAAARSKSARFGEDPTKVPAMVIAAGLGVVLLGGVALIVHGLM